MRFSADMITMGEGTRRIEFDGSDFSIFRLKVKECYDINRFARLNINKG